MVGASVTVSFTINRTPPLKDVPRFARHGAIFRTSYGLSFGARIGRWYTVVRLDSGIPRPAFPVTSLKQMKGEPDNEHRPGE